MLERVFGLSHYCVRQKSQVSTINYEGNRLHYSLTFDALSMEFMQIRFIDKKKNCDKDFFLKEGPCQLKMAVTGRKMT